MTRAGRRVVHQIEGVTNIPCGLPSLARILRQALLQHAIERSRRHGRHRRGFALENGGNDTRRVLSVEGTTARQHLVEHKAEREEVAARIRRLALRLLRRHVLHRPQNRCVRLSAAVSPSATSDGTSATSWLAAAGFRVGPPELRQPEVEELDALRGHEDVGRLQVAMRDALAVRGGEGREDLSARTGARARAAAARRAAGRATNSMTR